MEPVDGINGKVNSYLIITIANVCWCQSLLSISDVHVLFLIKAHGVLFSQIGTEADK